MNLWRLRAAAGPCLLLLAGSGCVSSHTPQTEEPAVDPVPISGDCRYYFAVDGVKAWFRASSVYSYEWGPAESFGYRELRPMLLDISGRCPRAPPESTIKARLEGYFLEYSNKPARATGALLFLATLPYTLGFVPLPTSDHYAVCLQITADDGLVRKGSAAGQLKSLDNLWGSVEAKEDKTRIKQELMRELSLQAWRKAWEAQEQATPQGVCLEDMDAIRAN